MTGALARVIDRAATRRSDEAERCGLCAAAIGPAHRHLLDERDATALCVCTACTLLFDRDGAGAGHYRLIPVRRTALSAASTAALDAPVGLAFFVKQDDGRVRGHYPSPVGTTEAEVDPGTWRRVERQSPALAALRPRVEAYLVRANPRGREEHWVVPVDDCFRLVAVIRRHWTGMSGGGVVWREVARFFHELKAGPEVFAEGQ
jgi:hypothetical protein